MDQKKRMPIPIDRMTTSVVNGQIYLIGGWDFPDDVYATVFQYNPEGDIWTRKADMPTARGGHAAVVFEERSMSSGVQPLKKLPMAASGILTLSKCMIPLKIGGHANPNAYRKHWLRCRNRRWKDLHNWRNGFR